MIADDGDFGSLRQRRFDFGNDRFDLLGDLDDVLPATLDDADRNRFVPIHPCFGFRFFEAVPHRGDIGDIDGLVSVRPHDQPPGLLRIVEFSRNFHEVVAGADVQITAGRVQIVGPHGLHQRRDRQVVRCQALRLVHHADFPFESAGYFGFQNALNGFEFIGEIVGNLFQAHQSDRPR